IFERKRIIRDSIANNRLFKMLARSLGLFFSVVHPGNDQRQFVLGIAGILFNFLLVFRKFVDRDIAEQLKPGIGQMIRYRKYLSVHIIGSVGNTNIVIV